MPWDKVVHVQNSYFKQKKNPSSQQTCVQYVCTWASKCGCREKMQKKRISIWKDVGCIPFCFHFHPCLPHCIFSFMPLHSFRCSSSLGGNKSTPKKATLWANNLDECFAQIDSYQRFCTDILHQSRNGGPPLSRLCFCFYLTHGTSRAGILSRHSAMTHASILYSELQMPDHDRVNICMTSTIPTFNIMSSACSSLTLPSHQFAMISLLTPVTCSWSL